MVIEKIELYNWMPFKGKHIINCNVPFTHIVGTYARNNRESNGSGKSSILQAIYYCLYERNKSDYVHIGTDSMYVKLYFSDGTILQKGTDGVWLNGEKTTNALMNAFVERMFNISDKMFLYTHCVLNGDIKGLFNLSPKEQKEILMSINNHHIDFDILYNKAKSILSAKNKECDALDTKIEYLDEKLSAININDMRDRLVASQNEQQMLELELKNYEKQMKDVENKINKLKNDNIMLKMDIQKLQEEIDRNENNKRKLEEIETKLQKLEEQTKKFKSITAERNALKEYENKLTEIRTKATILRKQIESFQKSGGNCPILQEQCPKIDLLKVKYNNWVKEYKELVNGAKELASRVEEHRNRVDTLSGILQEIHALQQSKFSLPPVVDTTNTQQMIQEKVQLIADNEAKLQELEKFQSVGQKERLLTDLDRVKQRINVIENTIKTYEEYKKERDEIEKQAVELRKQLKVLAVAVKLLSPHGLPYYLAIQTLKKLEDYTNEFLSYFHTGIKIYPYQELNTYEERCVVDGYKFKQSETVCPQCQTKREKMINPQITIYSTDRGIRIENESTGRKAIFYLALRFGFMRLLGTKGKIFIADELFANLDDVNKVRMLDMIKYATEKIGIEQTFIVSNDELRDILPADVTILRKNNTSMIV